VTAPEATIEQTDAGAVVASPGWFVLNMADSAWTQDDRGGEWSTFGEPEGEFEQYGIGIHVLKPGQVNGLYHSESVQEDFLVLSGECLLLIEEEEHPLKAWDFVHCPPGTTHSFVGTGDVPCVIFMTGGRSEDKEIVYPRSELAIRHGAGVETETRSPREAYAPFPKWEDGRPKTWDGLPWG
jgi:uncharacterized cupin superfamily protein